MPHSVKPEQARHFAFALSVLVDVFLIDQVTKYFSPEAPIPLLGGVSSFSLTLHRSLNTVFAFSIPAPIWLVGLVVAAVLVFVATRWWQEVRSGARSVYGLSLVLGGALGNIVDRFWHGGVLDWIEVRTPFTSTGSFNIADAAIVVGVLLWFYWSRKLVSNAGMNTETTAR